jgi:hypothetical protein
MRELIAEEEASKAQSIRAERQAQAIDKWRNASPGDGNHAFFGLGRQLVGIGMSDADIPTSDGLRSVISCGRCVDQTDD